VGFAAASLLAFPLMWGVADVIEEALGAGVAMVTAGALFGAFIGAGLGIGQWLVLRSEVSGMNGWIPASIIAGAAGLAAGFAIFVPFVDDETVPEVLVGLMFGAILGLALGIGQSLILRRQMGQAGWWVLFSTVALAAGMGVGLPLGGEGREVISLGSMALVIAAVSGIGMVWLLRQPVELIAE